MDTIWGVPPGVMQHFCRAIPGSLCSTHKPKQARRCIIEPDRRLSLSVARTMINLQHREFPDTTSCFVHMQDGFAPRYIRVGTGVIATAANYVVLRLFGLPPTCGTRVDGLVYIHRRHRTEYRYKYLHGPAQNLLSLHSPYFSKIHSHPSSQRLLIWSLVSIDPGILSMLSRVAFTSRISCWRSFTDRSSWGPGEDGESFFRSVIVFLSSLLEGLLGP